MSFEYIRKVPTVAEVVEQMPSSLRLRKIKKARDAQIIDVLRGKSRKFLLIIGPCSADNQEAVFEYVRRLASLQKKVSRQLVLIPRIYTNKPRTTAEGYKGMMHQPDPKEEPNIVAGIRAIRKLHLRILEETGLSAADEMLYPANYPYLEDLLSYVAIGARSVENQQHRLTVSGLDIPVGMKNPTSGDLNVMFNSIQAAQAPHVFVYRGWEVKTSGNPYAHAILRGAVNHHGQSIPNYHHEDLELCGRIYAKRGLRNPAVIIDTNHANSAKVYQEQPRIAEEVMDSMQRSPFMRKMVKGLMIESYLKEGSQSPTGRVFGQSITDPCLGWEDSRKLILELAGFFRR